MDGWGRRAARRVALHAGPDLDLGGFNGVAPEAPPGLWEGGCRRILNTALVSLPPRRWGGAGPRPDGLLWGRHSVAAARTRPPRVWVALQWGGGIKPGGGTTRRGPPGHGSLCAPRVGPGRLSRPSPHARLPCDVCGGLCVWWCGLARGGVPHQLGPARWPWSGAPPLRHQHAVGAPGACVVCVWCVLSWSRAPPLRHQHAVGAPGPVWCVCVWFVLVQGPSSASITR